LFSGMGPQKLRLSIFGLPIDKFGREYELRTKTKDASRISADY